MTQMLRKQIYIPKRQQVQLKRLAKARGVSEAARSFARPLSAKCS